MMEDLASAFAGLSGFSPMMMINRSCTCATTRLIQCRGFGVYQNDISAKFDKSPDEVPDLAKEDFLARKKIIDQVAAWVDEHQDKTPQIIYKNEWVPILYGYEIVKGSAKRNRDWGHLIFTDLTLTRYLLVMCFGDPKCNCGSPFHHDYDAIVKYNTDRFMSLLKYLHHDDARPNWVRATYTTSKNRSLDPDFLNSLEGPKAGTSTTPPIFHVTPDNFTPSLLASDIEKIDNLLTSSRRKLPPSSVKNEVLGKKEGRPEMKTYLAGNEKNKRQCAYCEKVGKHDMPMCGRCKLVRYCSPECQKAAWVNHKIFCKKATSTKAA
ncbi:hypothetical protein GLOTRDRAFT_81621 [Gloeophyllum trabeum ATCC 11539]|uniref:MYND-type domain-containing protein n=1 Tax=Gloeophyllum trabeum (strain ATCC 11539 / FP-39264 / Madison 617) TaxID=670483 RepID=S7REX9_GLOTA|nr:uncharacterized protein GLOTRDRAFT_81621 [Gloeophyllum trabeum ATCC 11539]EPQ51019.1 hypothetical protein GLOTRDRAFT_81621 [Gloeophyllum trabeum ATCC 11539]